ncbi:glycosyltransferase family 4 protein [Ottowia sp. VDI28]|uniref:glycosyltransferase family 4 protein n=1 Tax=Ottowia sp. VDI28 TaxID=3133968 RepID=UPI003C2C01B0
MERLNWHIADELSRHADIRIVGPAGSEALRPTAVQLTEVPLRPLWRFLQASAWQAVKTARTWKPHIVLAGSGLTAPAAWMAARASSARACTYLHGLDAAVQHPIYRALWHPAIRGMHTVIANSKPTAELAKALGVSAAKLRIVHPGVQIPDAPQPPEALQAFRQQHDLGNARILLSIGRLTTRKGLREFVEHALPDIVRSAPETLLVVIGDAPADALHASMQTRESIQAVADAAGIGQHLRFLRVITDPMALACAYECASLHVFPVRSLPGDPEGFGMVAIEAAAHGVPTVAFATGGVVDAVAPSESGHLVRPGDYSALSQTVLQVLEKPSTAWKDTARFFAQRFAWPTFGETLYAALLKGRSEA